MAYYQVRESFMANLGGANVLYQKGEVVSEGDPAFRKSPHLFEPLVIRGQVEQATAAPGEKRSLTRRLGRPPKAKAAPAPEPVREPEPVGKAITMGGLKGRT